MNLIHAAADLNPGLRKVCVAIGVFDGVHLGHQQVIRQTIADARQQEALAVVITFDRHPNAIVAPDRVPPLIYPLTQKLRVIESFGVDTTLLLKFDRALSEVPAETFVRHLERDLGRIQSLCVGSTFTFGHRRTGNVDLLKKLGQELYFAVHGLAAVALDGQRVSSTRIREAIRMGDLDAASQMLGRAYSISGPVVQGDKVGRQIGFPTANIDVTGLALPPNGVYAAHTAVDGKTWRAAVNIGTRPTLRNPAPTLHVEAHLLDFTGDLYGRDLEITLRERLRDERPFASVRELQQQIERDVQQTRTLF
jgi:riboflavin kinase / FMN adenylyltransferase